MKITEIYEIRKKVKSLSREELEQAFLDLSDDWLNISEDLSYRNAIIDGSWPSADECIKISRTKAAKHG
tara:strand:- start:242 stop:448 length:207 start_codon:yes stop_codon:yes gene_type:complete